MRLGSFQEALDPPAAGSTVASMLLSSFRFPLTSQHFSLHPLAKSMNEQHSVSPVLDRDQFKDLIEQANGDRDRDREDQF
jgi:hypothetical protein